MTPQFYGEDLTPDVTLQSHAVPAITVRFKSPAKAIAELAMPTDQVIYPPLRGTFMELDDKNWFLYTRGSVDFYMAYPGMYVPKSLEITPVETDESPRKIAEEILALTKMNCNNTQFDSTLPIAIKASRQVGAILQHATDIPKIEASYAYYM